MVVLNGYSLPSAQHLYLRTFQHFTHTRICSSFKYVCTFSFASMCLFSFFCLIVAETCSHTFCIVDTSVLHVKCCSGFRSFACQSCSVRVSCVSNVLTSASDLFVFRFDWSVSQRHAACLQVHSLAARFQGAVACSHGSLSLWLGFDGLRRQPHCLPYRSQMHCPSLPLQLLWQMRLESHGLLHVARRSWFVRLILFQLQVLDAFALLKCFSWFSMR